MLYFASKKRLLPSPPKSSRSARFGGLFLDLRAGEPRKGTEIVRLQDKPFQMLRLLLEHSAEVVTREELHKTLWPGGTVVEFDHGIATALKKLRHALGEDADHPRYIAGAPGIPVDGGVERIRRKTGDFQTGGRHIRLHRGAALRQPERGPRTGLLLRGTGR